MANEQDKPKKESRGYIRYIGNSHIRGITVEEFRNVGVTDQDSDVWWNRKNHWTVPRANLTDDAYNYAVKHDPELILVGGDKEEGAVSEDAMGDRAPLAAGMTPMPPGPEQPGDYVGGGSISGGSGEGSASTRGAAGTSGNTGGSSSGSTATK